MRGKITAMIVTGCLMIATITTAWAANTKEATKTYNLGSTGVVSVTSDDGKTKLQVQVNYGAVKNYSYNYDTSTRVLDTCMLEERYNSITQSDYAEAAVAANGSIYTSVDRNKTDSAYRYYAECDRYAISSTSGMSTARPTDILMYNILQVE